MILTRIDSMAYGGYGVARVDGFVHFVPGSAPGDLAEIEPVVRKKRHGFSRLCRIVEPSPLRTDPFCPYFGECGGCQYQHIRYPEQLRIKQKIFVEQMRRIGGLTNIPQPEMSGSEAKRIRMRFHLHDGDIGLYRTRSHTLCPIHECGIASPQVNAVLQEIQGFLKRDRKTFNGTITILTSPAGALLAATLAQGEASDLYQSLAHAVQGCTVLEQDKRIVLGEPYLPVSVRGLTLYVPPDAFSQVNPEINEILVGGICEFMKGSEQVMDLYCGCGNITLPLSQVCTSVVGVESEPGSVDAASHSASMAGITNASFRTADVLKAEIGDADGLVLDPPRSGLPASLIRNITNQRPMKIAYISCNPSTLARDLSLFVEAEYRIDSIRLLDMFPHTYHIESLTFLAAD
ncbi:MAG: class I SAM-dependent RNA methyltransferase [bacterium]